jgi:hypothetical protein
MPPRLPRGGFDRLPLVVVALMFATGVALELVRFGDLAWRPKLPLALLLVLAFVRGARARTAEDGPR